MTEKSETPSRKVLVLILALVGLASAVTGQSQLSGGSLGGLVFALLAVALWAFVGGDEGDGGADRRLLDVVLVVALAFHFWNLPSFPPGLFYDEAANALEAQDLLKSPGISIWSKNLSGRPTIFLYALGAAQSLFGDTRLTLRCVVVAANMATTLLLVWAIVPLVGARTARIAGAIFGFSFYHLLFSRFVYEASISSLPLVLAAGCLVRAATAGRRTHWWIGWGAALGAGLWTYAAFRIVPLLFVPVIAAIWMRSRGQRRRVLVGAEAGVATAVVVASPLLVFAAKNFDQFGIRAQETALLSEVERAGSWEPLLHNLKTYGLMFFSNPGTSNQIFQYPALAVAAAVLLWAGVGLGVGAIVRGRRRSLWLLLLYWWMAGLVPGLLTVSIEAPHWSRTLYALPAVVVVAALALDRASRLLGPRMRALLTIALLSAVLFTEASAANRHLFHTPRTFMFFSPAASEAGHIARAAIGDGESVLASDSLVLEAFTRDVFQFHAGERWDEVRPFTLWQTIPVARRQRPLTILFGPGDKRFAELLEQLYPSAKERLHHFPWGEVMLREYHLPAETPVPQSLEAGVLVRLTGGYTVHLPAGDSVRIGPWQLVDGESVWLPAGSWDVHCSSPCAKIDALLEGPETFRLPDRLLSDPFAGRGLIACYRERDGSRHVQLDRLIDDNPRGKARAEWSIARIGDLEVAMTGSYRFELISDDGSRLWIDGELLIDNWELHGSVTKVAKLRLSRGKHQIRIDYFQGDGGADLILLWQPPGLNRTEVLPAEVLRPPADLEAGLVEIEEVRPIPLGS